MAAPARRLGRWIERSREERDSRLAERPDEELLPDELYEEDEPDDDAAAVAEDAATEERIEHGFNFLQNRRRLVTVLAVFLALVVAIYVLVPKVVGLGDTLERMSNATWYWVVLALFFNILSFAAYVALFRGILGGRRGDELHRRLDVRASYQITMAGLAATRIFSAAGAGGIALTYWALRKAGMRRRRAGCRMVAFLVLLYTVYLFALVLFGVLPGDNPVGGTIVPAGIAAVALVVLGLVALIPEDVERRLGALGTRRPRAARVAGRLARGPATVATGVRTAIAYIRHPRRGALAVAGATGFWAANIAVLWASFKAFGTHVPVAVMVQGFFIGMTANLIPSPAGGVGSVDAGMIGAFLLFGIQGATVFAAVLTYRVIAFWLPIPPGIVAYFQLRRTVAGWQAEPSGDGYTSKSKVTAEAT
jgi:uncharacterized protein (TIRG00374 family)